LTGASTSVSLSVTGVPMVVTGAGTVLNIQPPPSIAALQPPVISAAGGVPISLVGGGFETVHIVKCKEP